MDRSKFTNLLAIAGMVLVCTLAVIFPEIAEAAGSATKAEEKGNDIIDFLTGNFGIVLVAISIAIYAIGVVWTKQMQPITGAYIVGGGIAIGSCVEIAQWIMA